MEIRLGTIKRLASPPELSIKDILTIEQYTKLKDSIAEIEDLSSHRRLLDLVLLNSEEFFSFFQPSINLIINKPYDITGISKEDGDSFFLNSNRLLLNYLSSVRTFLDHSQVFFNKKFGNKSNEFLEFKKILSYFFDHSFAYRFFNKLRNYSQHCGLPIDSYSFTLKNDREQSRSQREFRVVFNRDYLLSGYDGWGQKVKSDLKEMESDFLVSPLVFEMTHNMTEIGRNIELLLKSKVLSSAKYITDLTQHLRADDTEVCIFKDIKRREDGQSINFYTEHIPFETIDSFI